MFKRWKDQQEKFKHSMASNITGPKDIQLLDCKHDQSAWGRSIISWGAGNMKTDCLLSKSDGFHWSFFTILQFIENLLANHIKPTRQNWNTTAKHKSSFFRNRLQCIAPVCTVLIVTHPNAWTALHCCQKNPPAWLSSAEYTTHKSNLPTVHCKNKWSVIGQQCSGLF